MDQFEQAYQAYYPRVLRFLLALSGDEALAEELTQEVFFRAVVHIGSYQERGTMLTWLCTIGKNLWLNECRRSKRLVSLDKLPPASVPGPENTMLQQEREAALRRAVLALPADQRDVILLHIYGGISLLEISRHRGKSESWGKVTYYRAKQTLAQEMEGFK